MSKQIAKKLNGNMIVKCEKSVINYDCNATVIKFCVRCDV